MSPEFLKLLIATWCKPGFPFFGPGAVVVTACCLLLESGGTDELLLESGGTDCLKLENCP